jgi:hypothetical protein
MWAEADPDRPFDEQVLTDAAGHPVVDWCVEQGAVSTDSPGGFRRASDGRWYRWTPGEAAALPEGDTYARYLFSCPGGCVTAVKARVVKLDAAGLAVLRALHGMRKSSKTTVDALLQISS